MTFTYEATPEAPIVPADEAATGGWNALTRAPATMLARFRGPSARKELPDFTRQLATLLQAGCNAPEALQSLRSDVQSRELRTAVEALEIATKRGLPLYAAMRRHPRIFDRVYTEIVAADELSGTPARPIPRFGYALIAFIALTGCRMREAIGIAIDDAGSHRTRRSRIPSTAKGGGGDHPPPHALQLERGIRVQQVLAAASELAGAEAAREAVRGEEVDLVAAVRERPQRVPGATPAAPGETAGRAIQHGPSHRVGNDKPCTAPVGDVSYVTKVV